MKSRTPSVEKLFEPLVGLPCWNFSKGYGSFLTLEFGEPSLNIREPIESSSSSKKVREVFSRRHVWVVGQWHLWIYCCAWQVFVKGVKLASWESSDRKIENMCSKLDGQALTKVVPGSNPGETQFHFDLGGLLKTEPLDDEISEQWLLYCPDGYVYTFRSDGRAQFAPGDQNSNDKGWDTTG